MRWLEVAVSVHPEWVEAVSNLFWELGTGGVVVEDPAIISLYLQRPADQVALDGLRLPAEPLVKAYLPVDEELAGRLAGLRESLAALLEETSWHMSTREMEEEDWANAWKAYYRPVQVGKRLVVKPSWEEYRPRPGQVICELDPGMAFGCGTHATTRLCLTMLEEVIRGGEMVVDVGTGSGILAITAALLGAGRVVAVDRDPVAVATARQNVERNRVGDRVEVRQGDLLKGTGIPVADVIVANIVADVIMALIPAVVRMLKPKGLFIASGVIREREKDVRREMVLRGLEIREERAEGEWIALMAARGWGT
ncbi:MAG: 50S ribosomal protein L11 methyltransferase [Thermoanaerobacteraceae bacterium]|nr:50S ribosomal protein L11 methyltransferase [Thermoanaerobacteraceae bacterium]